MSGRPVSRAAAMWARKLCCCASRDTDVEGTLDPASANTACAITCAEPTNGTLVNNADGSFTYTPNAGFAGADSFVYEVCDAEPLCATATVTLTVSNTAPVANADSATTPEDTLVTVAVVANDTDAEGNLVAASANTACAITCTNPTNGTLVNNAEISIAYTRERE